VHIIFFVRRDGTLKRFPNLFPEVSQESDEEGEEGTLSVAEHYGWFSTLHHLAQEGGILRLTGDKTVTDVNLITVLNWLSLEEEVNKEKEMNERKRLQQMSWRK